MFSYVFMKVFEGRPRTYDRAMNRASRGRIERVKRAVASRVRAGSRALEIGVGTGELALMLAERGCTVLGFDSARGMVHAARDQVQSHGFSELVTIRHMGVDGMDALEAGAYDVVVSTLVFSELSADERRYALRHAARILAPGGMVFIADEVIPRSAMKRLVHNAFRAPALALTYFVTGSRTTPIANLAAEISGAGFVIESEERSHSDAFALVVGRRSLVGASS